MKQSLIDEEVGKKEFEMIVSQEHFENMWKEMKPTVDKYVEDYIDGVVRNLDATDPQENYTLFLQKMIKQNDKMNKKYLDIFDMQLMEDDYQLDIEGFKDNILKKNCDVIKGALISKTPELKEWKTKFQIAKAQAMFDTFYNFLDFAKNYNAVMGEVTMNSMETIHENHLNEMNEDQCYQLGIIGYGIVSRILNTMYPRVFPGNYKMGLYALLLLSGSNDGKDSNMPSKTSEFCMVKDEAGLNEDETEKTEHNYYYHYGTFGLYTLRIYRVLEDIIKKRVKIAFPTDYRFLLTNDFYNYVISKHKSDIQSLTGNADLFKFDFSF